MFKVGDKQVAVSVNIHNKLPHMPLVFTISWLT